MPTARPLRFIGLAAALIVSASASAQTPAAPTGELAAQITSLTTAPAVARAHWGVAITALDGTPIFGLNEAQFFRPASNTKLYTTAAAMHLLGPTARVTTAAETTAPVAAGGIVAADLILRGAGDANLFARHIPYESPAQRKARIAATPVCSTCALPNPLDPIFDMANKLAATIKEVHGDIIGDDTLWPWEPYAPDWSLEDDIYGDGPPVSPLTIADGTIVFTVTPGAKPGEPATISAVPSIPYFTLDTHVTTVAAKTKSAVHIEHDLGTRVVRIFGTVALGKPYSNEVAVDDPAEYAALALKAALEADGVRVSGRARAAHRYSQVTQGFSEQARTPLPSLPTTAQQPVILGYGCADACPFRITHDSPTLIEDVTVTLKVSQNLHAELMLKRLGKQYANDGSAEQGLRVTRQFLLNAGLDGSDFVFYDGSGLDSHDLVTPRATAKLLAYATTQPWFPQWKAALPIGGQDGSLASRFPNAPLKDHVFAKTGTLGESRALSGYLNCASGRTVIFSIMVDTHTPTTTADREAMDAIVAAIAGQL